MTLRQLRYVDVIAKRGSLTAAAEALYISARNALRLRYFLRCLFDVRIPEMINQISRPLLFDIRLHQILALRIVERYGHAVILCQRSTSALRPKSASAGKFALWK